MTDTDEQHDGDRVPCAQLPHESAEAYGLFERYVALAPERRRLDTVATGTGYSVGTLGNYSSAYRWRERAEACDQADELRLAVAQQRTRRLLLDQAEQLADGADPAELLKVSRGLDRLARIAREERRGRRHPQPRDGGGRFTHDRPAREAAGPDSGCECANPECRAALAGCPGGYCLACAAPAA